MTSLFAASVALLQDDIKKVSLPKDGASNPDDDPKVKELKPELIILVDDYCPEKSINKIRLDLNRYASGLYFVRLIYGGKSHFKKVTLLN